MKLDVVNRLTTVNHLISKKSSIYLTFLAAISGLIYLAVFTLPFPLIRLYNTIPPVDYTKLTNYSQFGLVAYGLSIAILFWLYIWAIRITMPDEPQVKPPGPTVPISQRFLLTSSAGLATISIFAYPLTAIDLFIYGIRTRGWALYGLNPLATAPEKLPTSDPWLGLAAEWVDAPSPYGPLWELLSVGTFYLSGGSYLAHLLGMKILMALAYLGCVWLVYKTLQYLQPQWTVAGTLAFAWNPLILPGKCTKRPQRYCDDFFSVGRFMALYQMVDRSSDTFSNPIHHSWFNSLSIFGLLNYCKICNNNYNPFLSDRSGGSLREVEKPSGDYRSIRPNYYRLNHHLHATHVAGFR